MYMDEHEIRRLLTDFENDDLEFKSGLRVAEGEEKHRVIRTVGAFYNTRGGILIFGVRDADHEIVGVEDPQLLETNLINKINGQIPSIDVMPQVHFIEIDGQTLVVVRCPKGGRPPYTINGDEAPRIRVGSNNLLARQEQIAQMYRDRETASQDRRSVQNATMDDLNMGSVERYYQSTTEPALASSNIEQTMQSEGFLVEDRGTLRPTVAGILLFGRSPQDFLPHAVVKASFKVRSEQTDWDDLKVFDGTILDQISATENFLKQYIPVIARISGFRRIEEAAIPMDVLREVVINALVHRDYFDTTSEIHVRIVGNRLEVLNPGGVILPLTVDEILRGGFIPRSRNAAITDAVVRMGSFMDKRGSGIDRISKGMAKRGLPRPSFEERAGAFRVSLEYDNVVPEISPRFIPDQLLSGLSLDEWEIRILELIESGVQRPGEIQAALGKSRPFVNGRLGQLVEKEVLQRISSGAPSDPNLRYDLNTSLYANETPSSEGEQDSLF